LDFLAPLGLCAALTAAAPAAAAPGLFSATGLESWTEQTFENRAPVLYRMVEDGGAQVLQADCSSAASGRLWEERIDLARTPVLRWRWKVDEFPHGAGEQTKPGDDFAARVYVVVKPGLTFLSIRSLVYVWAREAAVGADWPNPYTARAHHVALRSGRAAAGVWQEERRDLRADLKRYLDIDVERVDSVALMSDCDDTRSQARARYGDIRFEAAR